MFSKFFTTAVFTAALTLGSAATAETYNAYSHINGDPATHSLWFGPNGGSNPTGSVGANANRFSFENSERGAGVFEYDSSAGTASLTGEVKNAAGQGYLLEMFFEMVGDPGAYKITTGASNADWIYFGLLDTSMATALDTAQNPGDAASLTTDFDISLRGAPLAVQLGTGANDKDAFEFGLSTWIDFDEKNCTINCESYKGDVNIILASAPLPTGMALLPAGLMVFGAIARRKRRAQA